MPGMAARTLAWAADLLARVRKLRYEGIAIASRIPRMMITTRSSISVKPSSRLAGASRRERRESIGSFLLGGYVGWLASLSVTSGEAAHPPAEGFPGAIRAGVKEEGLPAD